MSYWEARVVYMGFSFLTILGFLKSGHRRKKAVVDHFYGRSEGTVGCCWSRF